MPLLKTHATDTKNETDNSSPASCSKVKQLVTNTKSGPGFILRNICLQLCAGKKQTAWSRTPCYCCCSSTAHCAPRPEQSAEPKHCLHPLGTAAPPQFTSARTRQKKLPETDKAGLGREGKPTGVRSARFPV